MTKRSILLMRLAAALSIVGFFAAIWFVPWEHLVGGFDMLVKELSRYGLVGSLVLMVIAALTAIPSEVAAMANGAMFGPLMGIAVTWSTAMIGASIAFFIGRFFGPTLVRKIVGAAKYETLTDYAQGEYGLMSLFVLRLIPLAPFFIINYAAGMAGMRFGPYALATGLGIVPVGVMTTLVGSSAMDKDWTLLAWMSAGILALSGIVFLVKRRLDRKRRQAGGG